MAQCSPRDRNKVGEALRCRPLGGALATCRKLVLFLPYEHNRKLNCRLQNINYFSIFSRESYECLICFDKLMNREGVYEHTHFVRGMRKAATTNMTLRVLQGFSIR